MTIIAYAFCNILASHRRGGKKRINGPPPQPSLPAVRHAIVDLRHSTTGQLQRTQLDDTADSIKNIKMLSPEPRPRLAFDLSRETAKIASHGPPVGQSDSERPLLVRHGRRSRPLRRLFSHVCDTLIERRHSTTGHASSYATRRRSWIRSRTSRRNASISSLDFPGDLWSSRLSLSGCSRRCLQNARYRQRISVRYQYISSIRQCR